jgi:hypothetical protein
VSDIDYDVILIDVTETPIQRPKKSKRATINDTIAFIPKLVDRSLRRSYNDIYDIRYKIQTKSS